MIEKHEIRKWDLNDLFPTLDSEELKKAFEQIDADVTKMENWKDKLDPMMDVEGIGAGGVRLHGPSRWTLPR